MEAEEHKASSSIHAKLLDSETSTGSRDHNHKVRYGFFEPICPVLPDDPDPSLTSLDLSPVLAHDRIFSAFDMASLWIGMVVSIPQYYLAGGLVDLGMSWWQGICTVFLGSAVMYTVLVLVAHPGTKYGLSAPVVLRAAFGVYGAHVPAVLRGIVGCGWYGIESWLGGQAVYEALDVATSHWMRDAAARSRVLGTSVPELACFAAFWLLQLWILWKGMEGIKKMERIGAPVLAVLTVALLWWAVAQAGGFGPMLSQRSEFGPGGRREGKFLAVFLPSLTACVGAWSTLSTNIPDFSRYTYSQRDQVLGQLIQPFAMAAFSFVGLAVTSATIIIFGHPISNPINLLPYIGSATVLGLVTLVIAISGILLAILTTNIAANVVGPANAFANLRPDLFTAKTSGLVVAVASLFSCPWKLLENSDRFIRVWLNGCSVFMGPVAAIVIADYYFRHRDIDDLYSNRARSSSSTGSFWNRGGVNWAAMIALFAGVAVCVPGFLGVAGVPKIPGYFSTVYDVAWFAGFLVAGTVYATLRLMKV